MNFIYISDDEACPTVYPSDAAWNEYNRKYYPPFGYDGDQKEDEEWEEHGWLLNVKE